MIKVLRKPLFLVLGAFGALGAVVAGKVSGRADKRVDGDDTATVTTAKEAGRRDTGSADVTSPPADPRPSNGSIEHTRDELYEEARRRGIKGRSKMSKAELEEALGRAAGSPDSGSAPAG